MAREQDTELQEAQEELAGYGRDANVHGLTKALSAANRELIKSGRRQPPPADDDGGDQDGGGDYDDGGEDDEQQGDGGGADDDQDDEGAGDDDQDDGADDEQDAAPPPRKPAARRSAPPARGAPGAPMGKSYGAGKDEALLKSLLLDEATGLPSETGEVIEVSDVLTNMTDAFAKSMQEVATEVGGVQLTMDSWEPMFKSLLSNQLQLIKIVKRLVDVANEPAPAAPYPGVGFAMGKSLARRHDAPKPDGVVLQKSAVSNALAFAVQTGVITREQYQRSASTLDSQGAHAALAMLPEEIATGIATAITAG